MSLGALFLLRLSSTTVNLARHPEELWPADNNFFHPAKRNPPAAGVVKVSPDKAFREIPAFVVVGIIYGALMIVLPGLSTWLPRNLL